MVSTEEEDDDDKKKKKDDDDEGLVANLKFRALIGGPNNAIVIFAESETSYMKSFTTTSNNGASTTRSYLEYKCGDIYAAKIEANGKIGWFSIFPKRQWERIPGGVSVGSAASVSGSYFLSRVDKPYYASYGVAAINNTAFLIFNDNTKNAAVTKAGQTVKSTKDFDKADCYSLEVNLATGQMKRRSLFSNNDIPNAMPKHGIQLGNNFYLIGKKEQSIGKTKLVVGRGTIK